MSSVDVSVSSDTLTDDDRIYKTEIFNFSVWDDDPFERAKWRHGIVDAIDEEFQVVAWGFAALPWGTMQDAMKIYPFSIHYALLYLNHMEFQFANMPDVNRRTKTTLLEKMREWATWNPLQAISNLGLVRSVVGQIYDEIQSSHAGAGTWDSVMHTALSHDIDDLERVIATMVENSEDRFVEAASKLPSSALATLVDVLQSLIDRSNSSSRRLERVLKATVKKCGFLPRYLFVRGVRRSGNNAIGGGGFADVWRGEVRGQSVALKVLRTFGNPFAGKIHEEFCQEAMIWRQFNHPNVLPFYGVCEDEFSPLLAMVSPFMHNGNIMEYLKSFPMADRQCLVYGIARGVRYLHALRPKVIHSDLRAANILVNERGEPLVADFGPAQVADSQARTVAATSFNGKGSMRWQAPELLDASLFDREFTGVTTKSDVYAFACVCLEVFTEDSPFAHLRDGNVILEVAMRKQHPPRPKELALEVGLTDDVWDVMRDCWAFHPRQRPDMPDVVKRISAIYNPGNDSSEESTNTQNETLQKVDVLSFAKNASQANLQLAATNSRSGASHPLTTLGMPSPEPFPQMASGTLPRYAPENNMLPGHPSALWQGQSMLPGDDPIPNGLAPSPSLGKPAPQPQRNGVHPGTSTAPVQPDSNPNLNQNRENKNQQNQIIGVPSYSPPGKRRPPPPPPGVSVAPNYPNMLITQQQQQQHLVMWRQQQQQKHYLVMWQQQQLLQQQITADLHKTDQQMLGEIRNELGMGNKDLNALSYDEKSRLLNVYRQRSTSDPSNLATQRNQQSRGSKRNSVFLAVNQQQNDAQVKGDTSPSANKRARRSPGQNRLQGSRALNLSRNNALGNANNNSRPPGPGPMPGMFPPGIMPNGMRGPPYTPSMSHMNPGMMAYPGGPSMVAQQMAQQNKPGIMPLPSLPATFESDSYPSMFTRVEDHDLDFERDFAAWFGED